MLMIYILIPISIILLVIAYGVFRWAVKNGQYDDLASQSQKIIFEDYLSKQLQESQNDE